MTLLPRAFFSSSSSSLHLLISIISGMNVRITANDENVEHNKDTNKRSFFNEISDIRTHRHRDDVIPFHSFITITKAFLLFVHLTHLNLNMMLSLMQPHIKSIWVCHWFFKKNARIWLKFHRLIYNNLVDCRIGMNKPKLSHSNCRWWNNKLSTSSHTFDEFTRRGETERNEILMKQELKAMKGSNLLRIVANFHFSSSKTF